MAVNLVVLVLLVTLAAAAAADVVDIDETERGRAVMAMGLCGQHRSVGGRKTQMRAALLTLAVIGSQLRTPVAARLPDRGPLSEVEPKPEEFAR